MAEMQTQTERIYVEVQGSFDTREQAARLLDGVAERLRAGDWQASNPVGADPYVTITSTD
ncbi:hypothetical protein RM190_08420 [Paracoccus sp. CPCC 101403]|uniref:SPOR domain-containing protein n=1 Tax=Paracoccus broussonetiae TaxID=3075834 RepID=A0ABU3ECC6_9RHOB|nr:hypothetical protein [Paracoccus sp. CPCC 101403]MDT1061877.1 hypothetical protein [Paracoccus sp. CPCC 101403]